MRLSRAVKGICNALEERTKAKPSQQPSCIGVRLVDHLGNLHTKTGVLMNCSQVQPNDESLGSQPNHQEGSKAQEKKIFTLEVPRGSTSLRLCIRSIPTGLHFRDNCEKMINNACKQSRIEILHCGGYNYGCRLAHLRMRHPRPEIGHHPRLLLSVGGWISRA